MVLLGWNQHVHFRFSPLELFRFMERSFLSCVSCLGPSGSTVLPSGSTAEGSQAVVPLRSGSTGGDSAAILPLAYQVPTGSIRGVFFCVGLCGTLLRQ